MEPQSEAGRRLVLAVIVAALAISMLVIVTFNAIQGAERLPQQLVRFFLTAVLCVFLYRGANWARWVAGILFALAGLWSLVAGLAILSTGIAGPLLLGMGLVYMTSAIILLLVPTVRVYFGAGCQRR